MACIAMACLVMTTNEQMMHRHGSESTITVRGVCGVCGATAQQQFRKQASVDRYHGKSTASHVMAVVSVVHMPVHTQYMAHSRNTRTRMCTRAGMAHNGRGTPWHGTPHHDSARRSTPPHRTHGTTRRSTARQRSVETSVYIPVTYQRW